MSEVGKLGLKLFSLAAVAGLLLGATNAITKGPIAEQQVKEANAARQKVLPEAADFVLVKESDGDVVDIYQGTGADGSTVGFTGKTTISGYGGPIEITVGIGTDMVVHGINVGGTDFAETAGLGAKTKEAKFTDQFTGGQAPFELTKNGGAIDAVTSATISSTAVKNGVNSVAEYLKALAEEAK